MWFLTERPKNRPSDAVFSLPFYLFPAETLLSASLTRSHSMILEGFVLKLQTLPSLCAAISDRLQKHRSAELNAGTDDTNRREAFAAAVSAS